MTALPSSMPNRKPVGPDPIHQQILGYLVENKMGTRTETRQKRDGGKLTTVRVDVPVALLAGNVSDESCDRAARAWLPGVQATDGSSPMNKSRKWMP